MVDISFNIACKELKIAQFAQINQFLQFLNLARIYGIRAAIEFLLKSPGFPNRPSNNWALALEISFLAMVQQEGFGPKCDIFP